ncbi:hypothetical protein AB0C29_19980 [Actinoplanes sp. NPDC048791]|uniref:hypothetical protein n=1 Tax=Actinoplanes sp. NPDC048791 TaxID=3154623 RepID=UPI00340E8758
MRSRLLLALSLTTALLGPAVLIPGGPAGAAPAAETTPPVLKSIELSRSAVTVSGLQTVMLEVRVRLTDETGVEQTSDGVGGLLPYVTFSQAPNNYAALALTEGTPQDGIWTGEVAVTSAWKGTVRVDRLAAYDKLWNLLDIDPGTAIDPATVQVTSSHRPGIDMTFPEPAKRGKPVVMTVRVWDTDTGRPWPNAPLVIGNDNGCVEWGFRVNGRTGSTGTFRRTVPANQAEALHCVWVPGTSRKPTGQDERTIIAIDAAHLRYSRFKVSAAPAKAAAPAGSAVDVTGSVSPLNKGKVIRLQRYTGGAWKNVNTGRVRASGRYTVVATPPGKASYSYRVYAPGDAYAVGGSSKAFTIRGT